MFIESADLLVVLAEAMRQPDGPARSAAIAQAARRAVGGHGAVLALKQDDGREPLIVPDHDGGDAVTLALLAWLRAGLLQGGFRQPGAVWVFDSAAGAAHALPPELMALGVAAAVVAGLPEGGPAGLLAADLPDHGREERAGAALAALAALTPALLRGPAGAEQSLARAALDALPDGVEVYNAAGQLALVNRRRRRMFAERLAETGLPLAAVIGGLRERVANPERLDAALNGDPATVELETLEPEPQTLERVTAYLETPGAPPAPVVVYRDITRLRRSERLKDEFLSIASHELKTPLTTIKGYSQMLQRRLRNVLASGRLLTQQEIERAGFEVEQVRDEADRLNRLVDQLLDVSRIQTGRLHVSLRPVDLRVLLSETMEGLRAGLDGRVLAYASPRGRTPLTASADSDRLKQVVCNLIENAVRYSSADSPVEVRLRLTPGVGTARRAQITVRDHGMGIEPAELEQIFDRFFRSSRPKAVRPAGMGLGLYISREIVRQHGGRIWAESAGTGQGSTFNLELPLVPVAEPEP